MMDRDRCVRVDGIDFRCRIDGPGTGRSPGAPWLAFSNSLMTDLTLWDGQVAALADRFRILRYDQRGHGGTVSTGPADFDRLSADLAGLLDALDIAAAVVVGISMGAVTALRLAQRCPARVRALVLCDGNAATPPAGASAWDERVRTAAEGGMAALVEPTVGRWFTPAIVAAGGEGIDRVRAMIRRTPFEGFVQGARALQSFDFRTGLPAVACPALLIAGAEDGALPEAMRAMAAAMPDARFAAITEAGHLPNIERPAAFDAALSAFLEPFSEDGRCA